MKAVSVFDHLGHEGELKAAAVFLCSLGASFVTGQGAEHRRRRNHLVI